MLIYKYNKTKNYIFGLFKENIMDIQKFISTKLKEAEDEKNKTILSVNEEKKMLKDIKEYIKNSELPDSTGVLEKLEKAIGKPVIIDTSLGEHIRENFDYDPTSRRVLVDKGISSHLTYGDYVKKITDAETGEVLFENKYKGMNFPAPMEQALLLGKVEGLNAVKESEKSLTRRKEYANESYEQTKKALENIPAWIERGGKLIYPERYEKWTECVCYRASDLYHGLELVNALEVMEALESGMNLNQVGKVISDNHSGASFSMLVNIVSNFSKRGPEFLRAYSEGYKYALRNGKQEELRDYEEWLSKLEAENKLYASKHSGETPPQPND